MERAARGKVQREDAATTAQYRFKHMKEKADRKESGKCLML
jgi:hypothetical protein